MGRAPFPSAGHDMLNNNIAFSIEYIEINSRFFADPCLSMFSMTVCTTSSRSVGLIRKYMLQRRLLHAPVGGAEAGLDLARCGGRDLADGILFPFGKFS